MSASFIKYSFDFFFLQKWFDYDIDSDEEWEEEDPDGESLRGSDDEKDEENPDDDEYDVDNEFMVPHGYLSDEEAQVADEEAEDMVKFFYRKIFQVSIDFYLIKMCCFSNYFMQTPETQKIKLKVLGEQLKAEMSEKTTKLKPKVIGCIWQGPLNSYPESSKY